MPVEASQMVASGQPTIPPALMNGTDTGAAQPKAESPAGTKPVESAPTPTSDPKEALIASKLEQLTKKEVWLAKMDREVKAAQAKLKEEQGKKDPWEVRKAKARQNPEEFAKEVWGDKWYDHLTTYKMDGVTPQEWAAATLDEKLAAFKAEQEAANTAQAEQAEKANAEAVQRATDSYQAEIATYVTSKAKEGAEVTAAFGPTAASMVFQVADEFYRTTGKMIEIPDAVARTEAFLMTQLEAVLSLPKVQARVQELIAASKPKEEAPKTDPNMWKEYIPESRKVPGLSSGTGATTASMSIPNTTDRVAKGVAILDRIMAGRK